MRQSCQALQGNYSKQELNEINDNKFWLKNANQKSRLQEQFQF